MNFLKNLFNFNKPKPKTQVKEKSSTQKINHCKHGVYNHQLFYKCCKTYMNCSFCHKEQCDSYLHGPVPLLKLKCKLCQTEQSSGNHCKNDECNVKFADNFCKTCTVWSNSKKKSYHCDKCNKCYINIRTNLVHCDTCNQCYYNNVFDKHKCSMNKEPHKCQICFEYVINSPKKYYFLECNHVIHNECYNKYHEICQKENKITTCCLCKKTIDQNSENEKKFDQLALSWSVSNEQTNWKSEISCIDCEKKSTIKYHSRYRKCAMCKSYNTYELKIIKEPTQPSPMLPSAPPIVSLTNQEVVIPSAPPIHKMI